MSGEILLILAVIVAVFVALVILFLIGAAFLAVVAVADDVIDEVIRHAKELH